jgi:glycosyltransferase involved in cell wall biosynthesis
VGSLTRSADAVAALRKQIRRCGLEPRVAVLGELTGDALEWAFQSADLFVLPTRHEGYGMVVAEALARGIPVLSTRTGAIPELVGTKAGLLVPPGDGAAFHEALETILRSPALLASLREGARAARDRLPRWPESCARMSQLLERVMAA